MVPLHWLFSKTYDASQLRQVAVPVDEMSHWLHPVPQPEKPSAMQLRNLCPTIIDYVKKIYNLLST